MRRKNTVLPVQRPAPHVHRCHHQHERGESRGGRHRRQAALIALAAQARPAQIRLWGARLELQLELELVSVAIYTAVYTREY